MPDVKVVDNYADDVKPNYVIPESYVRFTGNSLVSPEFTPYDLDSEDETWLAAYNGDQQRLPADRFERLLYTLEATCSAFVEKRFQVDAALAAERGAVISLAERQTLVASTSTLSKQAALESLRPSGARQVVCNGACPAPPSRRVLQTLCSLQTCLSTSVVCSDATDRVRAMRLAVWQRCSITGRRSASGDRSL